MLWNYCYCIGLPILSLVLPFEKQMFSSCQALIAGSSGVSYGWFIFHCCHSSVWKVLLHNQMESCAFLLWMVHMNWWPFWEYVEWGLWVIWANALLRRRPCCMLFQPQHILLHMFANYKSWIEDVLQILRILLLNSLIAKFGEPLIHFCTFWMFVALELGPWVVISRHWQQLVARYLLLLGQSSSPKNILGNITTISQWRIDNHLRRVYRATLVNNTH